jgi:hypothetical protein
MRLKTFTKFVNESRETEALSHIEKTLDAIETSRRVAAENGGGRQQLISGPVIDSAQRTLARLIADREKLGDQILHRLKAVSNADPSEIDSMRLLEEYSNILKELKKFYENPVNESVDRLAQLGMADPLVAAQRHLIRISQETEFPLTGLDDTLEEDDDSGEKYFVPLSPVFNDEDFDEESDVDWSMFTVGIEPDGGVNFHYDASPQLIARLHSEEDSRAMSQFLAPVPVPYSDLESEDWQAVCANIAENNAW